MEQTPALMMTLACEVLLVCWLLLREPVASIPRSSARTAGPLTASSPLRVALAAALASLLTHPLAWHFSRRLGPQQYLAGVWWIESAVVLLEAVVYRLLLRLRWTRALGVSLLANALSAGLGWWLA